MNRIEECLKTHLIADTEFGDKARIFGAFFLEDGRIRMPTHHHLKHRTQETAVTCRLIFSTRRHRVRYVTKDLKENIGLMSDESTPREKQRSTHAIVTEQR